MYYDLPIFFAAIGLGITIGFLVAPECPPAPPPAGVSWHVQPGLYRTLSRVECAHTDNVLYCRQRED